MPVEPAPHEIVLQVPFVTKDALRREGRAYGAYMARRMEWRNRIAQVAGNLTAEFIDNVATPANWREWQGTMAELRKELPAVQCAIFEKAAQKANRAEMLKFEFRYRQAELAQRQDAQP